MGADIHPILEKKFGDKWIGMRELVSRVQFAKGEDGVWKQHYVACPASSRNYDFFGALAGVRRDGPTPKGLPEDASELSRALFEQWDIDGHSHSWETLYDYIRLLLENEYHPAEVLLDPECPQMKHPYLYYLGMWEPEDGEEYRVVFCFDN